jgi:hypothetical protein
MIKSRRISELMNSTVAMPPKVRIRDYSKIDEIFHLYFKGKYDTMSREIYWYKDFECFKDIIIYLGDRFNDTFSGFYYRDMVDLYIERIEGVWNELRLKKEHKKYFK